MFLDVLAERLHERLARLFTHVQHLRSRARNESRILDRCKIDEPDPVGIPFQNVGANLQ